MACSLQVEGVFGPQVHGCGTDFDFTLLFEETILFILSLGVTICLAFWRIYHLYRSPVVVSSTVVYGAKFAGHLTLIVLSIAFVPVELALHSSITKTTTAAAVLGAIGSVVLAVLSHYEHFRSICGSTLLLLYYSAAIPADAARARTLWSMPDNATVASVFTALTACRCVVLLLEKISKTVIVDLPSRDEKADVYQQGFITWMFPVFWQGFKRPLTMDMLPSISKLLMSPIGSMETEMSSSKVSPSKEGSQSNQTPLLLELFMGRRWLFIGAIIPRLCNTGFTYAQPFLITAATDYMAEPLNENTYKTGGGLIAAFFLVYVGLGVSQLVYRQYTTRLTAAIRVDLVAKIYQHSVVLNQKAASKSSVATLMSNDVERVTTGLRNLHECWGGAVDLVIAFYLLSRQLSYATGPVGGISLLCILIPAACSQAAADRQSRWLRAIDDRIDATVDALRVMKGVKMTGIGDKVRKKLRALRHIEVQQSWAFRQVMGIIAVSSWLALILSPIVGFTVYILVVAPKTGNLLLYSNAYASLTLFGLLGFSTAQLIDGLYGLSIAWGCCQRVHDDLARSGHIDPLSRVQHVIATDTTTTSEKPAESEAFHAHVDSAIAVRLDHVSARWQADDDDDILKDVSLTILSASIVAITGATGCGKSSVLNLILGEMKRSSGEIAVSAPQIAYCSQTPWLTNESIKSNIIGCEPFDQEWYSSVVAMAELREDIARLRDADDTIIGSHGVQLSGGQKKLTAIARAIYSKSPLILFDEPFAGLDAHTEDRVVQALFGPQGIIRRQKRTAIWVTSHAHQLSLVDKVFVMTSSGRLNERPAESLDDSIQPLSTRTKINDEVGLATFPDQQADQPWVAEARQPVPEKHGETPSDFLYYVHVVGIWRFFVFVVLAMCFVFGIVFPQVWLQWWATEEVLHPGRRSAYYVGIFFLIGTMGVVGFIAATSFYIVAIAEKSAYVLHETLLDTVLRAPISFSDNVDAGDTINRFSQDLQLIDMELPLGMILTATSVLLVIGQCGIIIWASPWSGIAVPPLLISIALLLPFYLRTSHYLRLLEIQSKAPVFSHFLETLAGLPTIRAFAWIGSHLRKNARVSSDSQKPFFLFLSGQNWLLLTLSCITAGLAVIVMAVGVATKSSLNAALGLALFNVAAFSTTSKDLVYVWAQMEVCLGAAGRIREFAEKTTSEVTTGTHPPPHDWPDRGSIDFRGVSFRYAPTAPLALSDVSFTISPGQKFGICGRTGSGKSTLLSSLLRAIDLEQGTIFVDDVDIATLDRVQLRNRFITLPQEPLILTGTVRENMQLFGEYSDDAIKAALDSFDLWKLIERNGGLDIKLSAEVLSQGQRQLFCFARATLQTGKVLILDEPTSQLDRSTELRLQAAIIEQFAKYTVLCIAHRLETIVDFDTVVVMDQGCITEIGNPQVLLRDGTSAFASLLARQRQGLRD